MLCFDTLLTGHQYSNLRKFVQNHKYTVITMLGRRDARHIVHGDGFPRLVGNRESVQVLLLDGWIGDGACSTESDIFPNIQSEFWPIKVLL